MKNFSELFSAFDYIDEIIYICDMDTYDLVYCNKKLQENLLEEYQENQLGYKCYKCLHKLDHPCVFCNNSSLRKNRRCIWTRVHPVTGKYYLIHDSVITIGGKDYRMELAVDATHLEEAAVRMHQKLAMETHLTDCVRSLVKSNDFSDAVSAVLQTVLNYFGGERAYIFEFNWEKNTARNTFEICAPGISAEIDNLQSVPIEHMQRWIDIFNKESVLIIEDLEQMKDNPDRQIEYHDLKIQGINSLISVPILADEGIVGCVGVDNPSMHFDDSDFMVDIAYFLGVEIKKNYTFKELQDLSFQDPLTGVYNRKGLEQITGKIAIGNLPIAFLMVDIDNFKIINDTYGHSVGDEILKETASLLTCGFRSEDTVFRLGGDELAVLLCNCNSEIWKTICAKIQWIHASLAKTYKNMAVTLSAGICFASGEYNENIYNLADEAMYYTKKNGRAGCTMIIEKTGEKKYWKDNSLSAYNRSVLNVNSTGLYSIEYPLDEKIPPRMICSSEVKEIFSLPVDADAETCYKLWLEGIESSYLEVLADARNQLLENEEIECTYRWNHPEHGSIFIRTNGVSEIENNIQIIYGYHHSMKDTRIVEKEEDSQLLLEAISSIYFGSYYINLSKDTYTTIKYAPNERFLQVEESNAQQSLLNFVSGLVRESDHSKMIEFVNLDTLPQRMKNESHLDCEYYAVIEKKWCRATFIPVKYYDDETVSHVLFEVAPLDVTKAQEAEESSQQKKTIESLYNNIAKKHASLIAVLGAFNQLCYEYDPQTHQEVCLTEDHVFHLPRVIENYPESLLDFVHPEDHQIFLDTVHSMDHGKEEANCNIRLLRDGEYVWYAGRLQSIFDSERGRSIVSISFMDNSEHMAVIQNYQTRMNIMMGLPEDAISFEMINLTQNTFTVTHIGEEARKDVEQAKTLDELFQTMMSFVVGNSEQAQYSKIFSRNNLIACMKQGQTHMQMEHMYRMSPKHVEWVRTCVDMLRNPTSGDIVGVFYKKSVQNEKITSTLLEKTLQRDYPLVAIVEVKSDRYYLFASKRNEYCIQKNNFWENIAYNLALVVDDQTILGVQHELEKEHILKILNSGHKYSYAFNIMICGENHRMEVKFHYIDDKREMILATLRDITDSVIMNQLRHDNERDHLTDLYNRRKIFAECEKMLKQHPDDQFAMLHFDIRHFRLYNTFFGDVAGDKLLCDIADMFRNMDKDYEYWAYGRIEADVFCVFFPISQNKYQKHLNDLLHGLQDYRPDFLIEPAIGIYTVTDRSMPIESMFSRASIAAKTVRAGVTNAVIFYDDSMEQSLMNAHQVINDMQMAIEQEQFHVYLQPKYSLETKKPVGAEALVRWIHPQKGLITPNKFVPVFEGNGFIAILDRYMWEHVCQLLRRWQDEGYEMMPVSVNVSRISMYSPTTVQFLKDLVAKYQLDPQYLELELTESAYMDEPEEMKRQLRELQDYGFHILMDDFGSGYSSLNTLRELPVNCLKLDKEFLTESTEDERGRLVLTSVVQMSKILKLTVIAEGVETEEQAAFLDGIGCEYVQGYLFAKPMPVENYEQMIRKTED